MDGGRKTLDTKNQIVKTGLQRSASARGQLLDSIPQRFKYEA